jgi:phage-related protein/ABC-type transporter Mla subunit MlaD
MPDVIGLKADVEVTGTRKAEAELERVERKFKGMSGWSSNITGANQGLALMGRLVGTLKWPAYFSGASLAASGVTALTGAVVGLGGALGPVTGLLGALPGSMLGIAQVGGVLAGAFSGVGDAMKAWTQNDEQAARTAAAVAKQVKQQAKERVNAARELADAQKDLARAQEDVTEVTEEGTRRIQQAEERLADAQKRVERAQDNLNDARKIAARRIVDLQRSVKGLAMDEKRAVHNLKEAQHEYRLSLIDSEATVLDRIDLGLQVEEAELRLEEVVQKRIETEAELKDATDKGVEGSEQVVNALETQQDASKAVITATEALSDAQREHVRDQQDAAQRIVDSQQRVTDAIDRVAEAADTSGDLGSVAMERFRQAMENLSPQGKLLVEQLRSMSPLLDDLRERAQTALFPGLIQSLQILTPTMGSFNDLIDKTGGLLGDLSVKFATMISGKGFIADLNEIGNTNLGVIESVGNAFMYIADGLRHIAVAAQPLTQFLGDLIEKFAGMFALWAAKGREDGSLTTFFEKTARVVAQVVDIFGNLWGTLKNIFGAAAPLGEWMLTTFQKVTESWQNMTGEAKGSGKLTKFFMDMIPPLQAIGRLIEGLGGMMAAIATDKDAHQGFINTADAITTDLLPAITTAFTSINQNFGPALVGLATEFTKLIGVFGGPSGPFTVFVDALTNVLKVVNGLAGVPGFSTFVASMATFKVTMMTMKIMGAVSGISALIGPLKGLRTVMQLGGIGQAFAAYFPTLAGILGKVAPVIRTLLSTMFGPWGLAIMAVIFAGYMLYRHWDTIKQWASDLWQSLQVVWDRILETVRWAVGGIASAVHGAFFGVVNFLRGVRAGIWDAISGVWGRIVDVVFWAWNEIGRAIGGIIDFFVRLPGRIWDVARRVWEGVQGIGSNIINGLANGVGAAWPAFKRIWNNIIDMIPGSLADFLKINSPSRVMMGMGEQIGMGLAIGIRNSRGEIQSAMAGLGESIPSTFGTEFRTSAAGASTAAAAGGMQAPTMRPSTQTSGATFNVTVEGSVLSEGQLAERMRSLMAEVGRRNVTVFAGR